MAAPRLSGWVCPPWAATPRPKNSGSREELTLPRYEIERPHVPQSGDQGDLPHYTCAETLLGVTKRGGPPPQPVRSAHTQASAVEPSPAKGGACMREDPETPQMPTQNQAK